MAPSSHASHLRLVAAAFLLLAWLGWSRGAHAQTCPSGYPVDCGNFCCDSGHPYCCADGTCSANGQCGSASSGSGGGTCQTGYGFCSNNGGCCPTADSCCPAGCCAPSTPYCCGNSCSASPSCGSGSGGSSSGSGGSSSGSGGGGNSTGSCNTVSDCPPARYAGASQVECTGGVCTYPGAFCNAGTSVCGTNCVCPIHSTNPGNGCVCDSGYQLTVCDGTPCAGSACEPNFMCSPAPSDSGSYRGRSGCSTAGSAPDGWGSSGLWLVAGATAIAALRRRRRRGTVTPVLDSLPDEESRRAPDPFGFPN